MACGAGVAGVNVWHPCNLNIWKLWMALNASDAWQLFGGWTFPNALSCTFVLPPGNPCAVVLQ